MPPVVQASRDIQPMRRGGGATSSGSGSGSKAISTISARSGVKARGARVVSPASSFRVMVCATGRFMPSSLR